jgi:hypothetical protein
MTGDDELLKELHVILMSMAEVDDKWRMTRGSLGFTEEVREMQVHDRIKSSSRSPLC